VAARRSPQVPVQRPVLGSFWLWKPCCQELRREKKVREGKEPAGLGYLYQTFSYERFQDKKKKTM
jgi:hypothetical protein